MQFTLSTCLVLLAAPLALAVPFHRSSASEPSATSAVEPVTTSAVKPMGGLGGLGGLGQIVSDHNRFVSNPASARVPTPASENNPAREGHRQAHAALGRADRLIPPVR